MQTFSAKNIKVLAGTMFFVALYVFMFVSVTNATFIIPINNTEVVITTSQNESKNDKTIINSSVETAQEQKAETIKETQSIPIPIPEVSMTEASDTIASMPEQSDVVQISDVDNSYGVPNVATSFKSYTYYSCLGSGTPQWELQEQAYSDENGLRKIDDYYLVAMGTYYSHTLGDLFEITTDAGNTFKVIICDIKADAHTDRLHQYTLCNNCMIEFYVDPYTFNSNAKLVGSVGTLPGFEGSIIKVTKLGCMASS